MWAIKVKHSGRLPMKKGKNMGEGSFMVRDILMLFIRPEDMKGIEAQGIICRDVKIVSRDCHTMGILCKNQGVIRKIIHILLTVNTRL